jgi:hypothetical protein
MSSAVARDWREYKYTDRDLRDHPELANLACSYLASYAGDFEYLRDARQAMIEVGGLPASIVRGVLNCMRTDPRALPSLAAIAKPSAELGHDDVPTESNLRSPSWIQRPSQAARSTRLAQCEWTDPHYPHTYGPEWRMRCKGVPFELDRPARYFRPVSIKTPFTKALTGRLIHRVGEGSFAIWFPNRHTEGFREAPSLKVKTACKYPSWIANPVLIWSLDSFEIFPDPQIKICEYCKELAK